MSINVAEQYLASRNASERGAVVWLVLRCCQAYYWISLKAETGVTYGNGGSASVGYMRGVGLGAGAECGVNEKGSLTIGGQAGGFGGGFSMGGDHGFGVKAVVFGFDVSIKVPRPSPPSSPRSFGSGASGYDPHISDMP